MEIYAVSLFTLGAFIILISSIGLIRMKTPYLMLQASGVAVSTGMFCIFFSAGLYFQKDWAWVLVSGSYFFILLSSPVATHLLALAVFKTPSNTAHNPRKNKDL